MVLKYLPDFLKNDREVVLECLKSDPMSLRFASKKLKSDRETVACAVERNGLSIEYAIPELQNDEEIVHLAMKSNSDHYYTFKQIVSYNHQWLNDREFVKLSVSKSGYIFPFLNNGFKNDPEIAEIALRKSESIYTYLGVHLSNDHDFMLRVIQIHKENMEDPNYLEKTAKYHRDRFYFSLFWNRPIANDIEFIRKAVKLDGKIISLCSHNRDVLEDEEIVFEALKSCGLALQYVGNRYRNTKRFVLRAVKSDGRAIKYVKGKTLQYNIEIVLEAVKCSGMEAYNLLGDSLKSDERVILETIKHKYYYHNHKTTWENDMKDRLEFLVEENEKYLKIERYFEGKMLEYSNSCMFKICLEKQVLQIPSIVSLILDRKFEN